MDTIKGSFTVKATPLELTELEKRLGVMRMMIEKRFAGALDASGTVLMMGLMYKELGSGGYVALERLEGTLNGRKGAFYLQHSSTMNRGTPEQSISVVPDSGSNQLIGLAGKMKIDIINGEHFYTFEYSL